MVWIVIIVAVIAFLMDSDSGKLILGAGAIAIGCLFIELITDIAFFITLAKICGVGIIVICLWIVLASIFG